MKNRCSRNKKSEMIDRKNNLNRAIRRGGGLGDVVQPGKRKRESNLVFVPRHRQRSGDRLTLHFSIAT